MKKSVQSILILVFFSTAIFCFVGSSFAQSKHENYLTYKMVEQVTGTVIDSVSGETLPGVNILVKGTMTGTSTDANGNYELTVKSLQDTLVFSFVGYQTQEVPINGRNEISIKMASRAITGKEMVVTGYGEVAKEDVSGSISSVDVKNLQEEPAPTVVQSMAGRSAGLFVKTSTAQPGDYSGVSYNIRGFGDPLIIIDGIPASKEDFFLLNSEDVDEVNILKDAGAAAQYGARAGNGVILVTTKRGKKQAPQFGYTGNFGLQRFTGLPHAVTSAQNAKFENVALSNAGMNTKWTNEDIQKFQAGNDEEWNGMDDPDYPNTDWWNLTLRRFAPQVRHDLNVRGGSEAVRYYVSGGYYYQEGLYQSNSLKNKQYNLRTNIDVSLTDNLDMGIDLSVSNNDYIGPSWDMEQGNGHLGIMMLLYRSRPQYPATYPDPTKLPAMGNDDLNPVSATRISDVGYKKWNKFTGDGKFNLTYDLPYGFKAKARFNYHRLYRKDKRKEKRARAYWYDYDKQGNIQYHNHRSFNDYNWLHERQENSKELNQQYFLSWKHSFGNHQFNIQGVYENLSSDGNWFGAQRIRYDYDIDYLFAGPNKDKSNDGRGYQDGRISQILSADYNYKGKYLIKINARRDGSPRFPSGKRWGIFPSISAGWRLSDEEFIKPILPDIFSNLKLRASYGKLGNDRTGAYQYLSTYSINPNALLIDGEVQSGINSDNIANPNITWEKMYITNIGLDFGLFENSISGTIDVFYRKRTDVLGTREASIPNIVGAELTDENIERYNDRGIELSLDYKNNLGAVFIDLGGNISYSREKIGYISQPEFSSQEERRRLNRIGHWSDNVWGYKADGVFTSQEEINNWAVIDERNNATVNVGDIKLIDYNSDGVIDSDDQQVIGRGTSPDLTYGIRGSVSWKGINFSMLWQGAGLNDIFYGNPDLRQPFRGGNAPFLEMYKYSYVPKNQWGMSTNLDSHPIFPRFYWPSYDTHNTNGNSSFWYKNGSYIRLKSVQLRYTLSHSALNRIGADKISVYLSGYNVLTFSALDFFDPELIGSLEYPPTGTYNIGLSIDF